MERTGRAAAADCALHGILEAWVVETSRKKKRRSKRRRPPAGKDHTLRSWGFIGGIRTGSVCNPAHRSLGSNRVQPWSQAAGRRRRSSQIL